MSLCHDTTCQCWCACVRQPALSLWYEANPQQHVRMRISQPTPPLPALRDHMSVLQQQVYIQYLSHCVAATVEHATAASNKLRSMRTSRTRNKSLLASCAHALKAAKLAVHTLSPHTNPLTAALHRAA